MEPGLAKAQKIMDYINSSPEEIELYENRELTRMDIKSAKRRDIQEGIEIGEEKGIKKGTEKEKIETAKRLKNMGLSINDVVKATELTPEFIEKL